MYICDTVQLSEFPQIRFFLCYFNIQINYPNLYRISKKMFRYPKKIQIKFNHLRACISLFSYTPATVAWRDGPGIDCDIAYYILADNTSGYRVTKHGST